MLGIECVNQRLNDNAVLEHTLTWTTELSLTQDLFQWPYPRAQSLISFILFYECLKRDYIGRGLCLREDRLADCALPCTIDQAHMLRFQASEKAHQYASLPVPRQLCMEAFPPKD